ncbi:MAG: YhcN/YlaJ family sporulation lipoprotein [Clostridiales bacterium]|nr:YhcN/YlaJ family sporulation lipoprotein [Clostridiales bacterium]
MNKTKAMDLLDKFKYPLLILVLGVILMLLPTGSTKSEEAEGDERIQQMLSSVEGVGEAQVIISDNGVVVVCRGAENAAVRLDIIRAISAYTGFGSDRITILKLAD